jgi:hypothetical protein
MSFFMRLGDYLTAPLLKTIQKTSEQGARTTVFVATNKKYIESLNGGEYFFHCKVVEMNRSAVNDEDAEKLWEISEKLSGFDLLLKK